MGLSDSTMSFGSDSHDEPARITATERINGSLHRLVLEQDRFGTYREVIAEPCPPKCGARGTSASEAYYG